MLSQSPRPGFATITPYLIVPDLEQEIAFLQQAFGATEHYRAIGGAGGWHAELRIGDSMIMLGGGSQQNAATPLPAMLFLYLEQVDAVYAAAIKAGATPLMAPTDGAFGEPRGAGIKDPAGNDWYFATWSDRPEAPPAYRKPAEPQRSTSPDVIPMLDYEDGPAALDWLAAAFGFQEVERWLDEQGRLSHGEMLTGNGRIMLATPTLAYESPKHHREHCAQAQAWAETPWVIDGVLVYVDDVEHHYARAKAAGATILTELEPGFPGHRYRAEDLEGHRWMFMQRPPA